MQYLNIANNSKQWLKQHLLINYCLNKIQMNFTNAQTFCGSLLIYSANNGAIFVCAKNQKDKQNKRKQKRIKTKRKRNKKKSPTGCGLEPPEAAAHQLAQPAIPRDQPIWPAASPPSYCSSPWTLSSTQRCSTAISRAMAATATLQCRLALKYSLARPEASPRSISPPPRLVIVGARTPAKRRRHGCELTRPVSSPRAAVVSQRSVVVDNATTREELDRDPQYTAQPRRFPVLLRRPSPSNSSPSAAPKLPSGHRAPPGELLLHPQTPPLVFFHRGRPRHWSRGSPPR